MREIKTLGIIEFNEKTKKLITTFRDDIMQKSKDD